MLGLIDWPQLDQVVLTPNHLIFHNIIYTRRITLRKLTTTITMSHFAISDWSHHSCTHHLAGAGYTGLLLTIQL